MALYLKMFFKKNRPMKKIISLFTLFISTLIFSQTNYEKVYIKDFQIYLVKGNNTYIIPKGELEYHSNASLSPDKKLVTFILSKEETSASKICTFNLSENKLYKLVETSNDCLTGGSKITYKNTKNYPFPVLCSVEKLIFDSTSKKIYFSTEAWAVSHAIHLCDIKTGKISFVCAGSIIRASSNGNIIANITGVDENGRWTQDVEFSSAGKLLKRLTQKQY